MRVYSDPQFADEEAKRLIAFPNRLNAYPVLSDSCLEWIAVVRGMGGQTARPRDSILFREGDESLGVYVLWEGRARLTIGADNGKSIILGLVGPGTMVGLPAAVLGLPHASTVQVVNPAKVSFLGRDDLVRYLHFDARAAYEAAEMVSALYYSTLAEIKTVHLCESAEQKLARFFLGLRPRTKRPSEPPQLTVEASQEEIGQMVGITRETVARIVSRFKKKRILEIKNSTLVIHDHAALEKLANLRSMQAGF